MAIQFHDLFAAMGFGCITGVVCHLVQIAFLMLMKRNCSDDYGCGKCGYDVRGNEGVHCPECGSDLRVVGIKPRCIIQINECRPSVFISASISLMTFSFLCSMWL